MGITEELLAKKQNGKKRVQADSNGNIGITQILLQRKQAGLRAMPSPAETVGRTTAMEGPMAAASAQNIRNLMLQNRRNNAPSPTQAVQQLGLNVSPMTTMELPTATEPDYVAQALEDNGRLEEIQQEIQAAQKTQWDNPLPKGVASGLKFAQTMRENPEEGLKQVRANLEAQDQVKALTREQDRIQYIRSNAGKTYEDNFFGQFGASYALGRMRQDESLAWNKYLEDPTEENRAYAEAIGQLANKFEQENKATLAPDATLPWVSQSLANYLPQFWDQVQYGAVGAIGGAAAGSAVPVLGTAAGIKAGITAASGLYSYQTMRGAAFKTLLDMGASEEVAREAAGDEAVVSSLIEMADTGIDLLTLGGGKLISAITKGGVKNLAKEGAEKAAESAGKKLLKALGKYGLNVAGEFTEEATQQAVSIANANRVEAGVDNGILGLMADAGYGVLWEAAENADDPNRAEILKAGFQGAIVAGLMGPMQAGFNQLAFTGLRTMDNKVSADYGQQLRQQGFDGVAIEAGMKFPEGSGVYNMAQALQQKQQAGQEITDVELGDLYRSIKLGAQQELQNTVQTARSEAARQQSMESGILLPTADDLEVIGTTESRVRETGMLAGAREADIESAERISQAMGRNVEFFREEAGRAGTVNGFYDANTGTIYINSQSQNPVAQIIAHELTHSVELAESYQELKTLALEQLERDGVNLEERRQQVRDLYQRNGKTLDGNEEIDSELVAQFVETKLLTDEATIMELTRTNRPLMERVLNWINRTLQQLGLKKTTERDTLERAREIYAKALRETQVQQEAAVAEVQETGTREVVRNAEQLEQQETMDQEQLERQELEQDYRNVIQMIRKSLEAGSITEEEFDATFDAILEDASRDGIDLFDNLKYSFGGENAKLADLNSLKEAKKMKENGEKAETIFQKTGWFTGTDGKWRFEIDDSNMQYSKYGDMNYQDKETIRRLYEIRRMPQDKVTDAIRNEFGSLMRKIYSEGGALTKKKLSDYIEHTELFDNYPGLKNIDVVFEKMPETIRGYVKDGVLFLNEEIREMPEKTLLHEIQHIIQQEEGFARGSNPEYWSLNKNRGQMDRSSIDLYENTAGEIEARDVEDRRGMNSDQRRNTMPNLGNENTVFAVEGEKLSISESTDSQGRELSPEQVEFFRDSKVRDEDGRLKVMYHGTPYGGFTVFREGTYFTDNPQYAEVYHTPSASSIRGRYDPVTLPMTYAVYLNIKKPFDTRNEDAREIFYREYYRQYGMGTDLQESGLPDWLDAEDLREFLEENEYDYDGLIVDEGGTGGYDEEVRKRGLAYIAFRPDQIKRVDNLNPTSNPDIRYSVSDDQQKETDNTITLPMADSESQQLRDQLPVKAKTYLQRAERSMMNTIGQSLSIPYRARRDILTGTVQQMSEEYLQTGRISEETRKSLFEEAYEAGIVQDREFLDQYQGLRDYLRDTTLQISKKDSADIPDFNNYRRRNFGRMNISTSGGTNIDQVYKELAETWPEFFNEYRESTPSDQLNRISEVVKNFQVTERSLDEYYGPEAETFKKFAYHDFSAAIDEQLQELQAVRRYQEQSQRQQRVEDQKPKTIQEVVQLWDQFKQEKKRYEKVAAKNLLTEEDERLVGQLLRGEITELALDPEINNVKGILAVYESKREFDRIAKQLREWNADRRNALKKLADQYLTTANGWKDKRSGILYSRETMERNIRDIVPDEALAQSIIDQYFTPVHKGTAAATRMKNTFRQRVKDMNLSRDIAKGNIVSEAHAVQLLGEAEDNIRYMERAKWTRERDGKTIDEWRQVVADLWKENPNLDQKKIRDAVTTFRSMYDELFQKMNEVRVRNGYEPINYRSGYFPHFQPGDGDGIIAAFGRALGISTEVTALPTSINGLTHTFKPGIQWFGNAQERLGFNTAYDAVEGFDKYIEGVADVVHHTDNIQKLRQLANQVRYRTTSEGIRKQVDAVLANDSLAEIDKQNRIEDIYKNGRFSMSNFVVELEEYTNLLANKKSRHDRSVETDAGRAVYNLVKTLEGRVAANMVSINPASWLTNFIPLAQGNALLGRGRLLKGMWDTLRSYKENDGFVEQSTFLTNRRGSDPLVRSWQKGEMPASGAERSIRKIGEAVGRFGDIAPKGMELIDNFVSDTLVRARYAQNLAKGMSEASAMDEADNWTAGVMADRSKGSIPTLFERRNPFTKLATQFQLEVNNQLSYLFKDIPRETKQAGAKVLTWALVKFAVGAWLYDEIYEYLIGRRPALDPIGILNDTVGDLTGWELPNLVELGVGAVTGDMPEFRTEKTSLYDAAANLGEEVLEQVPFTGALNWIGADLDAGRLPISNAIPDIGNMVKALTDSELAGNKRADLFLRELADTAGAYLVLPYGGGQLKKILQTAEAVVRGGRYSVNNEGELQLQYPVFNDEATDIAGNAIWGSVFGPTTLPTGREWVENGFGSLSVDQTIAYEAMKEAGAEDETAFQVIQDYRAAEDNEARREVIRNADINGDAKAALYYQLMASDTERQQLDLLDDAGQDMGQIIDTLLDIKDMDAAAREDSETEEEKPLFDEKQIEAITAAGLKENDAALAAVERENIWANRDLTTDEKKAEFSRWLNEQDYSADEQHALYNAIIEGGESESEAGQENRYARLVSSGIDDDIAYAITSDISRLEPVEGTDTVSREQKRAVVFERLADPEQQLAALETINLESQQTKFEVAYEYGVKPEVYAAVIADLPNYDKDGNGSLNQEEVTNALNSMGRGALTLPGGANDFTLSTQDKAVIWQLCNKSWKSKNNPFGSGVGSRVYNALNAE